MDYARAFGQVLQRFRKEKGLTQEALGLAADSSRNFISMMERGQYQPTLATIFKVAAILKVRPSKMVAEVEAIAKDFGDS